MYIRFLWFISLLKLFMKILNLVTHCMKQTSNISEIILKILNFGVKFFVFH